MHEHWLQRWAVGQTGWHKDVPNPLLVDHVPSDWTRVLVPLCGASLDLGWLLERGCEVVGVELSRVAADLVFAERNVVPEITVTDGFERLRHGALTIWVGDFFRFGDVAHGEFDGVWDRAALIAIPPDMRIPYADALKAVAPDARMLLAVIDYAADEMEGPPHAVTPQEVLDLYPGARCVLEEDLSEEMASRGRGGQFIQRLYDLRPLSPS